MGILCSCENYGEGSSGAKCKECKEILSELRKIKEGSEAGKDHFFINIAGAEYKIFICKIGTEYPWGSRFGFRVYSIYFNIYPVEGKGKESSTDRVMDISSFRYFIWANKVNKADYQI